MRLHDWPHRLAAVVERHSTEPFAWGTSDCLVLVDDVHQALTGAAVAPDDPWRGAYKTKRGAAGQIRRRGHESLEAVLRAHLPEVPPALAQRGDVGVVDHDGVTGCAVCLGGVWLAKHEAGTLTLPRTAIKTAFHIE